MRFKIASAAAGAAMSISLLGATGAPAATEFGDNCVGDDTAPAPFTLTTLATPLAAIPPTAPISGVITKVKVHITPNFPLVVPQKVKLLRSAGGNNFTVISQTELQAGGGVTVASSRMPVQAGDRLGLYGPPFAYDGGYLHTFYCKEVPATLGAAAGDMPPGSTAFFGPAPEGSAPVAAIVEPDADNDGFGDETQDACPQSAASQGECPPTAVVLSTSKQVRKGSVTIIVTPSTAAPVTVKGVVKLGKGKKANLNGGTQNLAPGVLGKFTLKFTKKVKTKLKELSPKRSLRLNVTVSGTSVSGAVTTSTLKLKLRGQAKD